MDVFLIILMLTFVLPNKIDSIFSYNIYYINYTIINYGYAKHFEHLCPFAC